MLKATHNEVTDAPRADINSRVKLVLEQLPAGAPYFQPKHLAPILGITDNAFTAHCRSCAALRTWRGSYRFQSDDPNHMALLQALVKRILWSGRKLPAELRIH